MPKHLPRGGPYPRTRSRGAYTVPESAYYVENGVASGGTVPPLFEGEVVETNDFVVPGFRARSAAGEFFFNYFTKRTRAQKNLGGVGLSYAFHNGSYSFSVSGAQAGSASLRYAAGAATGHLFPIPLLENADIAMAQNLVQTRVNSERGKSTTNLYEDLAEFDKTVGMLQKPLSSFSAFNKKFARDGRFSGSAANAWLQYQYGIKPLAKSVQEVTEGLIKPRKRVRQTTRAQETLFESSTTISHHYDSQFTWDLRYHSEDKMVIRGFSLDEYYADVGHNIGLSTKGLLSTPWELVPYSFVADWFVNVGDFLSAHLPAPGFNQLGSQMSLHRTIVTTYTLENWNLQPSFDVNLIQGAAGSAVTSVESKIRTTMQSGGSLAIKTDFGFEKLGRVLTGLALGRQQLGNFFGGGKR